MQQVSSSPGRAYLTLPSLAPFNLAPSPSHHQNTRFLSPRSEAVPTMLQVSQLQNQDEGAAALHCMVPCVTLPKIRSGGPPIPKHSTDIFCLSTPSLGLARGRHGPSAFVVCSDDSRTNAYFLSCCLPPRQSRPSTWRPCSNPRRAYPVSDPTTPPSKVFLQGRVIPYTSHGQ